MTKDEALRLALEALEKKAGSWGVGQEALNKAAITAIKEALAQPEQEPVATMKMLHTYGDTTPLKRPWVGLTDEQREACTQSPFTEDNYQDIEDKLKELNT